MWSQDKHHDPKNMLVDIEPVQSPSNVAIYISCNTVEVQQ